MAFLSPAGKRERGKIGVTARLADSMGPRSSAVMLLMLPGHAWCCRSHLFFFFFLCVMEAEKLRKISNRMIKVKNILNQTGKTNKNCCS